jgi:fructokinase
MTKIFGAIEAGGTKFICATVDHQRNIIRQARIATTTPEETLGQVLEFFRAGEESIVSLGKAGKIYP